MIKGLKICGISDPETLNYILNHNHKPIMIGFITNYEKSKRFVEYEKLKDLINLDKKQVNFVSVLVNPNDEILEKIKDLNFDYYQLYDVSPERTKEIKLKFQKKIITALTISNKDDVIKYKDYTKISDVILFDSKGYDKSESFDHSLLDDVPSELNKMIAGNIQINDIPSFKSKDFIIDLSGALEDKNGKKDIKKLVLHQARLANKAKLDAIVCSAQEVKLVKKVFKKEIITPGIRFNSKSNDQKRVLTPKQAYKNGSDWLVMGRPITKGNIKKNIQNLIDHLSQ